MKHGEAFDLWPNRLLYVSVMQQRQSHGRWLASRHRNGCNQETISRERKTGEFPSKRMIMGKSMEFTVGPQAS